MRFDRIGNACSSQDKQSLESTEQRTSPAKPRPNRRRLPPFLVDRRRAARLCGVSLASWDRLIANGKTPAPVRFGGRVLWRLAELRAWCAAGCPDRRTWVVIWDARNRKSRT